MKKYLILLVIVGLSCIKTFGQKLTLGELINLRNKNSWEEINQILTNKGWAYYESEKGNTENYNKITWAYKLNSLNDKAQGWFYLFIYEGYPNKVSYAIVNKETFAQIQSAILASGFKLTDSEIEDDALLSTYSNSQLIITLSTEKRKENEWESKKQTAYTVTISKKENVPDNNNGKQVEYYDNDVIKSEFNLVKGQINGIAKFYHPNGQLKKIGNYINGNENGLFKDYDDEGNLIAEYYMTNGELNGEAKMYHTNSQLKLKGAFLKGKSNGNFITYDEDGNKLAEFYKTNGLLNGVCKYYENGKIDKIITYKDSIKNGLCEEYYYDEETGVFQFKYFGQYINNLKNGIWKIIYLDENKNEKLMSYDHYVNDIKNGPSQEINGDSVIICNYTNNKLNGNYKVYYNIVNRVFGNSMETDTANLVLIANGNYYNGLENGAWKVYDMLGELRGEGNFLNGKKSGSWKFYYSKHKDADGKVLHFSNELYVIQNYANGLPDGKTTRLSYLDINKVPCNEIKSSLNAADTCNEYKYQKVTEIAYYKNGDQDGPFELRDSQNVVLMKGNYKKDMMEGEWMINYNEKIDSSGNDKLITYKGLYIKDKKEGKWNGYNNKGELIRVMNYNDDELDGDYFDSYINGKPGEKKIFRNGTLIQLTKLERESQKATVQYELYNETDFNYNCLKTIYSDTEIESQEYSVKKNREINHEFFENVFENSISLKSKNRTGYKDGDYKLLNKKNEPIILGQYTQDEKIGLWKYYFYDQNVVLELKYNNNIQLEEKYFTLAGEPFSGEFTFINKENNTYEERKIKNGLRNGKTTYFDAKTDKTIKKEVYQDGIIKL